MFLAGGFSLVLVGHLEHVEPKLPPAARAVAGAGIITAVELAAGLAVNRDYGVWDYRQQPGNFLGQICPLFTFLWIPVSLLALGLYEVLQQRVDRLSRAYR